ncbi:uncharacterized protein LOC110111166 isoform X2 [Dendrobium catenatum]|uniref:uncharacterized protein LOC110111166 isoform X2 n=1 Tax=Dendrobium catenatum TaxID=906689 RepID=UPI0009F44274|nr:uncharacterized protein LOC110111166 isoform X2 [Dendrobium catenatum]
MVQDTFLVRSKIIKEDIASKHRARKIDKLNAPSLNKLETSGKKVPESRLRGSVRAENGGSSSNINSEKCANEFLIKNRKEQLRIGCLSTIDKTKKSAIPPRIRSPSTCAKANTSISPPKIRSSSACDKVNKRTLPTMKRNEDGKSVSSSTENSIRRSIPESKLQKVNGESRTLGVTDSKSEDGGKKTIRKHLHVCAYKKLFKKPAKAAGNHVDKCANGKSPLEGIYMDLGVNTSKEVKEGGDVNSTKEGVQDQRGLCIETTDLLEKKESNNTKPLDTAFDARSINQEHKIKFSGSKCGRVIPNLDSDNLLEPSGEEICNRGPCEMNMESRSSMLEELGVGDGGVCNSEFLGNPAKESTNTQTGIAPMHNVCLVCKQPGQLICCCGKGCKRSYHLSCFNPLLHDVPPGAWLCNFCVKKKMDLGVYSVADGIESVWFHEEGMQCGKRYFVKYKGLAHVHNRWIPESELLHIAPSLLANFRNKNQKEVIKWRKEWTEPERLLQKRLLAPLEAADECASMSISGSWDCCIEWFVKWKGLGYDQATWELENSLLLCSSEAARLIKDYECRREQANRLYDPLIADKALQVKKDPFCKMSKLPDECPVELDNDHLSAVNCLREFWHKSLNAMFIDVEERISKSVLFVLSLQSHACRPSLIIATSGFLQLWQVDFLRLAPSMNVIMYQGDKDARKTIQNLEFYEESGRLMFQVLLADPMAVVEDLVDISCIGWEAIIVDGCQNSTVTRQLEQLNTLNTDFKLLLLNGQMKDSLSEYRLLLSFLNTGGTMDNGLVGLKANNNDTRFSLTKLKEKLARHIVFECKTDSSKFLEYWVPVPLSIVQLEQYCTTLISNATVLRSNIRSDVVGALHNILITARKCCDHPYLVDGELRGLLTKGLEGAEFLNAEVCASGKFFLLGKILQGMKDRSLRVMILFQSLGGSEKVSLGDMLDDFLQQRFGVDTYERIETGMIMAKKVAALKKFNNKESGRFAFLIEKRACLPSVKLLSVDAIILFNSDWNPLNDLRSLHKITVESQNNFIRVFRFYTSYTVEEKLLMLAKEDIILDSSIESISRSVTHMLLGWGSCYLFQLLDRLHANSSPIGISEPSFEKLCLSDVILEILTLLPGKTETSKPVSCSILMKAPLSGETYSRDSVLLGEKEGISLPDKDLPSFWSGLLEDRHRKWMYTSEHSQRIRRRIQNADGLENQAVESDEVKIKRRKISSIVDSCILPEFSQEKGDTRKGGEQKLEDQRNLLILLVPELSDLCDILALPESVKGMAQEILVYIMNNHDVSTNKVTVLEALKISLCWQAASMLSHSLDHAGSLSIAKKCLKFGCTEQEAYSVYSKLHILKEKFPCQSVALQNLSVQNILNSESSPSKTVDDVSKTLDGRAKEIAATGNLSVRVNDGFPVDYETSEQLISQPGLYPIGENPGKFQLDSGSLKDDLFKNQIDGIEEVFLRRSEVLVQKQQAEVSIFKKQMSKDRLKLVKTHDLDLELIRCIHIDTTVSKGKINVLNQDFSDKLGRFDQHRKQQKQKLISMQLDIRNKEQELQYSWLEKAKSGKLDESLDDIPQLESGFMLEKFMEASEFGCNFNNSACPSSEKNIRTDGCLEVPSNILNEREENVRQGDDALTSATSVTGDNFEQNVQNRISVELSVPPMLSVTAADGRDDSNGLHLVPDPVLNQGALLSPVKGLTSSVSSSTSSSIPELCTNERTMPAEVFTSGNCQNMDSFHYFTVPASDFVVTLSPHIERMSSNDVAPSNYTSCPLPKEVPEQARLPPTGYEESTPQPHHSVELSEVPAQQEIIAVVAESEPSNRQIPENAMNPLRPQEFLSSEGMPSEHFGSSVIRYGVACDWLHSSTQQGEVPIQDVIEAAVFESQPSIQQISENNLHPMRLQEDLPLEIMHSEHQENIVIQPDEPNQLIHNFSSIEWVPLQAISTNPIHNEIVRMRKQQYLCIEKHENKKLLLRSECEQEIEKVKRKYDILLQDAEREHLPEKKMFLELFQKLVWHNVFAEEVRSKFYVHDEGSSTPFQARSRNSNQHFQASQPQLTSSNTIRQPINTRAILHAGRSPAPHLQPIRPPPRVSDPTVNTPLSSAPNSQSATPTLISNATPSVSPANLVCTFSAPFPLMGSSISNASGISQPTGSGSSPLYFSPAQFELPECAEADELLESMLANLPATNNEFLTESIIDSRPNASSDVVYLSDGD